ncbi:A-type flagellin [compost metagenome]
MIISQNIAALNTTNNLKKRDIALSKSIEKLSSGFRINKVSDDAAGLAVSESMRRQIGGLNQASRNIQDGISLIQTAEGAMQEIHSMLQRMNVLANQAANGTYSDSDRAGLQAEFMKLQNEIDSITEHTNFNGIPLLNGSSSTVSKTFSANNILVFTFNSNPKPGDSIGIGHLVNMTKITFDVPEYLNTLFDVPIGSSLSSTLSTLIHNYELLKSGAIGTPTEQEAVLNTTMHIVGSKVIVLSDEPLGGERSSTDIAAEFVNGTVTIPSSDTGGGIPIQTGPTSDDQLLLDMPDVTGAAIGISGLNISTASGASDALTSLKNAVDKVSSERARLGAYQNRLEHSLSHVQNSAENLSAAESSIRDTDMANEMTELTKNQIFIQAGQAMLAQANSLSESVVQLLK